MAVIRYHGKQSVIKIDTAGIIGVQDVSQSFDDGKLQADVPRDDTSSFGDTAEKRGVLGVEDNKLTLSGFLKDNLGNRVHGKNTRLWADQYLLGQWLDSVKLDLKVKFDPTGSFGDNGKRYQVPGKQSVGLTFSGKNDFSPNALDSILRTFKNVDPSAGGVLPIFSLALNGTAIGALGFICQGAPDKLGRATGESKIQTVDGSIAVDDQCDFAVCLHDYGVVETVAGNFASVNESAATTLGGALHLHATLFVGTNATIKFQHSTNNSVWVDLQVFADVTASAASQKQRFTIAAGTTVNQYVRAIISGGTFTQIQFVVWFARRGFTYGTPGTLRHFIGLISGYVNGTISSSTPLSASAFEFAPAGTTVGNPKFTGSIVLSDFSVDLGEEKPTRISLTAPVDGVVTPGTY